MKPILFLFLLLVTVVSLSSVAYAIVGGSDQALIDVPWTGAFYVRVGLTGSSLVVDFLQCSATFINERWVMTAFKCVRDGIDPTDHESRETFKPKHMFLRYGNNQISEAKQIGVMYVAANDSYPEIALLKLKRNITDFNNATYWNTSGFLISAPLPGIAASLPSNGDVLSLSGYGSNHYNGFGLPKLLQHFNATYSSNYTCGLTADEISQQDYLCFGVPKPNVQSACAADYGAPLLDQSGLAHAIYIESEGDVDGKAHCKGHGVYYRLDLARDWIMNATGNFTEAPASGASGLILSSLLLCFTLFLVPFF